VPAGMIVPAGMRTAVEKPPGAIVSATAGSAVMSRSVGATRNHRDKQNHNDDYDEEDFHALRAA
jgi:hypothetical protein